MDIAVLLLMLGLIMAAVGFVALALIWVMLPGVGWVALFAHMGFRQDAREAIWRGWEALATERGWTPKPVEHTLEGELDGVQLQVGRFQQRISGWSGDQHTRVRATQVHALRHLEFVLQREARADRGDDAEGSEFPADAVAAVAKRSLVPPLTTSLLNDPEVRQWLDSSEALDWQNGVVTCRFEGLEPDEMRDRVALAVAQVASLVGALDRYAQALADHTGLSPVPDPERVLPRLTGPLDGVAVEVRQVQRRNAVQVMATLPAPVKGLRIQVKEEASAPGIRLGDPVLDSVVTVTADEPELVRSRIVQDAARESLLVVLKGYPGSTVDGHRVVLACPTVEPEAVALATTSAVELARWLSGASESQTVAAKAAQAQSEQPTV